MSRLTTSTADSLYMGLCAQDSVLMRSLAEAAIRRALVMHTDVIRDSEIVDVVNTTVTTAMLVDMAINITNDHLSTFSSELNRQIRELSVDLKAEIVPVLKANLTFN